MALMQLILTIKLTQNCEEDNQFYFYFLEFSARLFPFPSSIFYQYYHGFHVLSLSQMGLLRQSLMFSVFLFSLSYLY